MEMRLTGWVLSLLVLAGCSDAPQQSAAPPPSVQVMSVSSEQVRSRAEFVGRTQAFEDVNLQPQISGQLLDRHFTEGQQVTEDMLLFTIDPASFEAEVAQANAVLKQATAARDAAVLNWQRGKRLHPDGMISDNDMDELTSRKLQAEAQVVQARSGLDSAQLRLSYTEVKAPIAGRISSALVSTGDLVTPQTDLATLVQADPIYVLFQASERQMTAARRIAMADPQAEIGMLPVAMILPDGQRFDQTGVIDYVDNRVDAATGTINLRVRFDNPQDLVVPGMYVNLEISAPDDEAALLIPQAAVQEDQQGRYVMLLGEGNTVNKRVVELGERFEVNWAVIAGLKEGDRIVVEGLQKIRPGAVVNPVEQESKPFQPDTQR
ncbi:efflux RND transporter periplasmic adaptor subunit [Ferrimonas pelagia]|uniref:Multidrug efflux RND transporter periplasmic adaptor subunit VmeY n=1 Tax=Ferrimonas pelagia TaxID=1177826 RepID=A0ABP9FAZ1_9GAMM